MPSLIVEELRRARIDQAGELLLISIRISDQAHVVAQKDGQPLRPKSFTTEFIRHLAKSRDLPRIFASTTYGTRTRRIFCRAAFLSGGVHPRGPGAARHSSVGIALDLYSHVLPGMQEDAAAKVDAVPSRNKEKSIG